MGLWDSGFSGSESQGVNPWTVGMLPQVGTGPGGLPGLSGFDPMSAVAAAGGAAGGGQPGNEQITTGDRSRQSPAQTQAGDAARSQQQQAGGGQQQEQQMPTREQIMADPTRYGMPSGVGLTPAQYADQYFHEFTANLAYKDPFARDPSGQILRDPKGNPVSNYTPGEQAMLRNWGYQASPSENNVIDNQRTGLFAVRFEPTAGPNGQAARPPIVAFRGTEPDPSKPQDLLTDLLDPSIGARQYDGNRADIARLMQRGTNGQGVTATGHSLGGALAERAAADNVNNVGAVTTFQAPGIAMEDAARFNAANADGHIAVNHHYVSSDIVHRAGDAKLNGNYFEHSVPGASALNPMDVYRSHTSRLLMDKGDGSYINDNLGGQQQVSRSTGDGVWGRNLWEAARHGLGAVGAPIEGAINGAMHAGQGIWDAAKSTGTGLANAASSTMTGLGQAGSTALGGLRSGGSEMGAAGSDLLDGNFLGALGHAGRGIVNTGGGLLRGAGQAAGSLWNGATQAVGSVGSGLWNAGKSVVGGLGEAAEGMGRGLVNGGRAALNLGAAGWQGAKALGSAALDGARAVGTGIANGASAVGHGIVNGVSAVGSGIASGASAVGRGVSNAWNKLTSW